MASNDSREFAPVLAMLMSHVAHQVLESFSVDELRALEQLTLRQWSHFNRLIQRLSIFGVMEPFRFRRKGATKLSA